MVCRCNSHSVPKMLIKIQEIIESDDNLKELCRDNNGNPNLGYVTAMDVMFPREEIKPECITNLLLKDYSL